ncbi:MAG: type II secretion system protein N, partial [Gammaproteobacteria bacterium]|nr:type II secretion system protein N [Gammaproteobacteria bacterium]
FSDAGGPLKISGQLLVTPKGEYKLNGSLAAREGPSSTLGRSLSMMGRADGQGNIALNMSGKLSEFGFLFK